MTTPIEPAPPSANSCTDQSKPSLGTTTGCSTNCDCDPGAPLPGDAQCSQRQRLSLDNLQPTTVRPTRATSSRSTVLPTLLTTLKRIEFVDVPKSEKRNGPAVYTIAIYNHNTESHIPVHGRFGRAEPPPRATATTATTCHATAQIDHTYAEILKLKREVFLLARCCPCLGACTFCRRILSFYAKASDVKPRWSTPWLHSSDSVRSMVSVFLWELLKLAMQVPSGPQTHCGGQELILRVLYRFLRHSSSAST